VASAKVRFINALNNNNNNNMPVKLYQDPLRFAGVIRNKPV